jgi:hypothetical protein
VKDAAVSKCTNRLRLTRDQHPGVLKVTHHALHVHNLALSVPTLSTRPYLARIAPNITIFLSY